MAIIKLEKAVTQALQQMDFHGLVVPLHVLRILGLHVLTCKAKYQFAQIAEIVSSKQENNAIQALQLTGSLGLDAHRPVLKAQVSPAQILLGHFQFALIVEMDTSKLGSNVIQDQITRFMEPGLDAIRLATKFPDLLARMFQVQCLNVLTVEMDSINQEKDAIWALLIMEMDLGALLLVQ